MSGDIEQSGATLRARRILVTGADGFLGWHTRAALRERGLDARGVPVGSGFDPAAALRAGRSRGLMGMRERAKLLGGELRINSAPGQSTTVTAVIPLG